MSAYGAVRRVVPGALLALVGAVLVLPATVAAPAQAADPCATSTTPVACENAKPGTDPSVWEIDGAGSSDIQGFATEISVDAGKRIDFKIDTAAPAYTVDVYRMGWYQGDGARHVTSLTPSATLPQVQPQCVTDPATDLYDCGNWGVSASWDVPVDAVSGVYVAHLQLPDGRASHITFVVRDDDSRSDVVFQTSDPTWQAYNSYGGADFYGGGAHGRAYKVSYNRPVLTRGRSDGRDFFMSSEYAMVRFLERNGYDVTYQAAVDTDRRGQLLTNHDVFLAVGHDEYWSGRQRANVQAARDAGVHLQFLSGNDMYWRTRWADSIDGSATPHRTLVSYKETWDNAKVDPEPEWTGTWRDPRYAPRSRGGGRPENSLIGTQYQVNFSDLALQVSAAEGKYRLWRNTSLASMSSGTATLAKHTVGYESNEDVDNGERPAGLVRLSTTTGAVPEYLQDFGNTVTAGTTTHHTTLYRAASGALVFSAGTVQWAWGLDEVHDSSWAPEPADPRMQQAQVNLFADMGVQPATLMTGMVRATKSTDTREPSVSISSPRSGASQANGSTVVLSGTASDVGGRVAGVEVSTDGGDTWHAAKGTTSWTYSYTQDGVGAAEVRVRASDDSANTSAAVSRTFQASCPCTVFGPEVPKIAAAEDDSPVELGLRFTPLSDGTVTGVRFYKGAGNTGTHTGSLWSAGGDRLAQATFTSETATGWQNVSFSAPVPVEAGRTYAVSYTAPKGRYALQQWAFSARGRDAGPLSVEGGYGAEPAGVFGQPGTFPTSSHKGGQYYVDVRYSTTSATQLMAMDQWPLPGASSTPLDTVVSAKFSKPLAAGTAAVRVTSPTGAVVAGATEYDAQSRTVTFTPSAPLDGFVAYSVVVTGKDLAGKPVAKGGTWTFTTVKPPNAPGVCPCTLFDDSLVPTVLEDADRQAVTLGVRFTPAERGVVTGVKFYKGPNNTGTHTGTLWNADGTQLATGTFTGESTSGWQTLTFDAPVTVRAGTEYVAGYRAPGGRYSATPGAFALADLSRPPLGVGPQAGTYTYGTGFPTTSSPTNYLVDVVFEPRPPAIAVESRDPAAGAVGVPRATTVKVRTTEPLAPGHDLSVALGQTPVAGTVTTSSSGTELTFTPAERLPADAEVTVRLTGAVSTEGAQLAPQTWTFRTRAADSTDAQSMFGDEVPAQEAAADGAPVELGTAFTPARDGSVSAVRFYRGAGNDGPHTGSLWAADGRRLATVTFPVGTGTGWRTATLPTPVAVEAGQTYVVSYYAPTGHYAVTPGFFGQAWTAGDLTAPATQNGRYLYGSGGGFPVNSFGAANYFVDVVFARSAPTLTAGERSPAAGATAVSRSAEVSLAVSRPLAAGWSVDVSVGGTPVAGTSALSADGRTVRFSPSAVLPSGADVQVAVRGLVSTEGAVLADQTWTFRTTDERTLFDRLAPAVEDVNDNDAVELGTAFTAQEQGEVTAIRFYKGPGNGGTHTGSLWSADGTRLATVTFTGESATGWQRADLATPVALLPGETYVVSYLAPQGHYSSTGAFFSSAWDNGPLRAPATQNGRYLYGAGGGFPTSTHNAANYFVDVVWRPRT